MMVIYVVVLDDVDDSESLTMTKEVHKLSFRIKRSVSKVTKQITSTHPGSFRMRIRIRSQWRTADSVRCVYTCAT